MNEETKIGYLRTDMLRIITDRRLYIAIIGTVIALFFALEGRDFAVSVLYVFIAATGRVGFAIVYVFCAYPFASCFSEDLGNNYIRYALIRGNLKEYVRAKVVWIMLTAIFVLSVGCTLFALICRIWMPWSDSNIMEYMLSSCMFRYFLVEGPDVLWYTLYGVQQGILAGILALVSSYVSLFVTNKMIVLVIPGLFHQILIEFSYGMTENLSFFQLYVFNPEYKTFENDLLSFGWALILGLLCTMIIACAIYKKVRRRI